MIGSRVSRRVATAVVVGALALPACNGGGGPEDPSPSPTVSAETPSPTVSAETPSPTATGIDITTVPDEITADYIQAVLDALSEVQAEATRQAMALDPYPETPEDLPEPIQSYLAQAFEGIRLFSIRGTVHFDADPDNPYPLLPDFEPYDRLVQEAPEMHDECIVVPIILDASETVVNPPSDDERPSRLILLRAHGQQFESNPTPWRIIDAADLSDAESLETALDRSCR